jgi:hypothetical protein
MLSLTFEGEEDKEGKIIFFLSGVTGVIEEAEMIVGALRLCHEDDE